MHRIANVLRNRKIHKTQECREQIDADENPARLRYFERWNSENTCWRGKTCCSLCYFSKVNHSAIPINFESLQRGASTSANPNGTHHHLRKVHVDNHPNHSPNNVQPFDQTIDNMTSDARIFDFVPGRHTTRPVVEVQQLQKTSSSFWDEKSRKKGGSRYEKSTVNIVRTTCD